MVESVEDQRMVKNVTTCCCLDATRPLLPKPTVALGLYGKSGPNFPLWIDEVLLGKMMRLNQMEKVPFLRIRRNKGEDLRVVDSPVVMHKHLPTWGGRGQQGDRG